MSGELYVAESKAERKGLEAGAKKTQAQKEEPEEERNPVVTSGGLRLHDCDCNKADCWTCKKIKSRLAREAADDCRAPTLKPPRGCP